MRSWAISPGAAIAAKALSHVGEREEPAGSNSGPEVDRYLRYVGLGPGEPWCAAFACYCVGMALEEMGAGAAPHPRSGSSGEIVEWAKARGKVVPVPAQGDLGIARDATSPTGFRHTTVVYHNYGDGQVHTVEGNEGDRVAVRVRPIEGMTYVRPY